MVPRAFSKRRSAILLAALCTGPGIIGAWTPACAQTAYIYGLSAWYAVGDTIQFWGDSDESTVLTPSCYGWEGSCLIDRAFGFRKATNVDTETCTADHGDTCYVHAVICCYWAGDCSGEISAPCWPTEESCWATEEDCGLNCYCLSLWRVDGFNDAPGDVIGGCYRVSLICDPTDEDCETPDFCDVKRTWWQN